MNPIQKSAFELDLRALKSLRISEEGLTGTLLSACSAHDADRKMQLGVIKYLIALGADTNECDKNGVTPLHRAVRFRNVAAVEAILGNGGKINAQDKKSKSTALHRAVTNTGAPRTAGKKDEIIEIIRILLRAGADTLIKNKTGKAPIEYVKDPEILGILKEAGNAKSRGVAAGRKKK